MTDSLHVHHKPLPEGQVTVVCSRGTPSNLMRKPPVERLDLRVEVGVTGDVHAGPGDRQVALVRSEVLRDLGAEGLAVEPGDMGENVVLSGVEAEALAPGAILALEGGAVLQVTGQRTPCVELEDVAPGLLKAAVGRCGCFARVVRPGTVRAGAAVTVLEGALP